MSTSGTVSTADCSIGKGRAALWFGLIGGGAAWGTHLLLAYAISEFGCVGGLELPGYLGISPVAWLLLNVTLLTTAVASIATMVAWRRRGCLSGAAERAAPDVAERYAAHVGLVCSGLFTLIILFESLPIFYYLRGC